jgi:hypothetical protein
MWAQVLWWVVTAVVSYALSPRPKSAPPPGVGQFEAPTAEEGREIPVLFGTREISGPNIVWYGDVKTVAIRTKGGKK